MVVMATGLMPNALNCADDSAVAILTYNNMVGTGQVQHTPECNQLWLSKYGP
jgi:hypothetical protein